MSTKSTIAHGANFHFYHEALDDDYVYLQLEGVRFEADYHRVMVPIPVHVWEVIRQHPGVDLSFAEKTHEELRRYVEQNVAERIKRYREASGRMKALVSLSGLLIYGFANEPRARQIAQGLEHYRRLRRHQRQIKEAIAELEKENKGIKSNRGKVARGRKRAGAGTLTTTTGILRKSRARKPRAA